MIRNAKLLFSCLISAAVALGVSALVMTCLFRPQTLEIGEVDLSRVPDGSYLGVCQNKILTAVVKVAVRDHRIDQIEVLEHKASYMEQAKQIARDVCGKQSLAVSAISGATLTSDTVLKAIENALSDADRSPLTK